MKRYKGYYKIGSPTHIQSQKMAPIQARPNLYLDTYQPCISTTLGALLHGKLVNLGILKSGLRKLARLYRKLDAFRVSDLGSEMGCEHYRRIRHSVQPDPTRPEGWKLFYFLAVVADSRSVISRIDSALVPAFDRYSIKTRKAGSEVYSIKRAVR